MKPLPYIYQPKPKQITIIPKRNKNTPTCADCRSAQSAIVGKAWEIVCTLGLTSCPASCERFRDARKPAVANEWQVVGG